MRDVPDDGHRCMVCVETANAADDVRTIPAGGMHTLAQTIVVADE
jgi:D-hexose-6-phosphate mutarotase